MPASDSALRQYYCLNYAVTLPPKLAADHLHAACAAQRSLGLRLRASQCTRSTLMGTAALGRRSLRTAPSSAATHTWCELSGTVPEAITPSHCKRFTTSSWCATRVTCKQNWVCTCCWRHAGHSMGARCCCARHLPKPHRPRERLPCQGLRLRHGKADTVAVTCCPLLRKTLSSGMACLSLPWLYALEGGRHEALCSIPSLSPDFYPSPNPKLSPYRCNLPEI